MKFKSSEIGLQFKVWCPGFNRIKHRLFLLGSIPELGTWNIYDALEAHPTTDNHTWQVDVAVPAASSFEWVWLRTGLNRTGVEWEKSSKRNRTVGYFSGTIHSIWAESEEVYLQSATFAEVTTYLLVEDGYSLVLTGSTPTTGLWDLAEAVPAREFPKKSGYWKAHVSFDALTNLYFQWAVVKEKDFSSVRMQEKVQHSITGRRCWMRVVAPWMIPVAVVVDLSIVNDTLDNVHGRTSIIVKERQKRNEEITEWINSWNRRCLLAKKQQHPPPSHKTSESDSDRSSEKTKVSDITREPSVDIVRQPAVRSNENLDDLILQTQERITKETKTERFTKELSKNYVEQSNTLKGQGQTEFAADPITLDVNNQVPLLDGGLCLLMFAKAASSESADSLDTSADDTEVLTVQDNETALELGTTTTSTSYMALPGPTTAEKKDGNKITDALLSHLATLRKTFLSLGDKHPQDPSGAPVIEKKISAISTYPPPTWSMLQQEDIEVTKRPNIVARAKTKTTVKVIPMIKALHNKKEPLKMFLERNMTEEVSTSRGPFRRVLDTESAMPFAVGMDDTSKSLTEIDDEQSNRQVWSRLRHQTGDMKKADDSSPQNSASK